MSMVNWKAVVRTAEEQRKKELSKIAELAAKGVKAAPSGMDEETLAFFTEELMKLRSEVDTLRSEPRGGEVTSGLPREPKVIEVKLPDSTTRQVKGATHKQFEHLLKMVGARLNVALIGEAGSGKTHATEQVADALGIKYWPMSFHAKMTSTDLRGYCDANGKYNPSALYMAMKQGGVLCLDEFDRSNTEVTVSLNNVLASGKYLFPNGELVEKHKDFVVVACQNTTGMGASKQYAAAQRQDASTLNRFVKLEWNVDEAMETAICGDTIATREVQRIRKKAKELGMDLVISPRQSIHANTLMGIGYSLADALRYSVYECLADDQVKRLSSK